jgi:hypothetical protein
MAKTHSSLTGADLHAPQSFDLENATEIWTVSQSINKINLSGSLLPNDEASFDLGSAALSWKDIYVSSGSIKFIDPSDNSVLQTLTADTSGISFGGGNVSGSTISGSKLHIVGDSFIGGNLTLGDADTDSISITADLTSNLTPNADVTYDLGTTAKQWKDLYVGRALVGQTGSLHISSSFTVLMDGKAGMLLPSASGDPTVSGTSEKGMTYFNTTDNLMKVYSGTDWVPVGSTETKDNILSIAADSDANNASSAIKMRVDGTADAQNKMILQSTNSHEMTGSINVSGSITANSIWSGSTAIYTNNIQNGYPTSNPWGSGLEGSYFNNFDNTTHVSEVLRFVAGIISHSIDTASPTANTNYWNTLSTSHTEGSTTSKGSLLDGVLGSTYENARLSQHWTSSAFIDMSETGSYRTAQNYLIAKGWVQTSDLGTYGNDTGTNPFHGSYASRIPATIQTQATLGTNSYTFTANASAGSSIYSTSTYLGMGPLSSGAAQAMYVRVLASQSFSDTYSDETPDENSSYTTQSLIDYSISDFGTSNGLVLAKIDSANPAVIPAAYQDGDFNSVAGTISGRKYTGGATSATSISASGYYATHDIKVGLKSGSQSDYVFKNGSDSATRFYLYAGGLPSDITNSHPTAVVTSSANITAFAATSRSLSGAPYLLTNTYTVTFDSEVSKSFDPAYGYASSPLVNSNTTDTWENIGSTTLSNTSVSVTNSGVQSTGANLYVIDSTKSTKRSSSGIPHRSDIAVASSSLSFTLDSNTENVSQNRSSNESLNYSLVFRARSRNWKNTAVDSNSGTITLYDAARFGQNSDSGSLAVYSRAQGYDSNTLQDTTETFTGEDFRIVLADNVQAFNGAYFTTDSFKTNDEGDSTLGQNDLQVKPGYLVDPSGSYGYWFTSDSLAASSAGYRYYIRRFQTDGSTYSSMTLDVGKTLVNWTATTSDSVAAAILFESSGNGSGNNSSLGVARIYDPTKLTGTLIEADMAADNFKNPFTTAISLYGNDGGSKSSTEYTIPISNAVGQYLDSNDNELYVIIRYKGDPSPVTSITLSFS